MGSRTRVAAPDRHLGAKPPYRLRKLETDISTTKHDKWHAVQLQNLDMRHRRCICQSWHVGQGRARAHVDKHTLANNHSCFGALVVNSNRSWGDEAGTAHDQIHTGGSVPFEMDLDEVFNHRAFAMLEPSYPS